MKIHKYTNILYKWIKGSEWPLATRFAKMFIFRKDPGSLHDTAGQDQDQQVVLQFQPVDVNNVACCGTATNKHGEQQQEVNDTGCGEGSAANGISKGGAGCQYRQFRYDRRVI